MGSVPREGRSVVGFEGERVVILRRSRACAVLVAFAVVLMVMML